MAVSVIGLKFDAVSISGTVRQAFAERSQFFTQPCDVHVYGAFGARRTPFFQTRSRISSREKTFVRSPRQRHKDFELLFGQQDVFVAERRALGFGIDRQFAQFDRTVRIGRRCGAPFRFTAPLRGPSLPLIENGFGM